MNTPTPRTDAQEWTTETRTRVVWASFARTLETELAATRSERDLAITRVASILRSGAIDKHICGDVRKWVEVERLKELLRIESSSAKHALAWAEGSEAEVERLTKQIKDDNRAYGCELRDPNGTIWEQAAKDHARAEKAEAECVEQARLLGMSGEREAALLSALKLMVSKFDAFIDSEYCGTDLLAEQLAQADFARKVIMGEARK